jgi:hypothetical protein
MIMKRLLLLIIVLSLFGLAIPAQDKKGEKKDSVSYSTGPGVFEWDPFLMEFAPGSYFYPFFIENYVPDATFLIEENNGFSLVDNPRVYFEGDSFVNFNWFYNGININSALSEGSPAVQLPFSAVNRYRMQGESPAFKDYGLNMISDFSKGSGSRGTASTVFTDLGNYWMTFMIQPDHPKTRADLLYNERRKIDSNLFLDYRFDKSSRRSHLMFAVTYFDIRRQFNDFNEFDATFREDAGLLLLNARFKKRLNNGYIDLFGVYNYRDRGNRQAELGALPQETAAKEGGSLLAGVTFKKGNLGLTLSLLLENEKLSPFETGFSKDLMDNDGDLTYPYGRTGEFRYGEFNGSILNANLSLPVTTRLFNRPFSLHGYADLRYASIKGNETGRGHNALFFGQTPYQVVKWESPGMAYEYGNTNLQAKAGVNMRADLSERMSLLANVLVNVSRLSFDFSGNNLEFVTPGFDVGVVFQLSKRKQSSLLFSYGRLPYHIRENANFFLERGRPSGTIHYWDDPNGDSLYQTGEEGPIAGSTGGGYHFLDENISAPIKERLMLNFSTRISKNFLLNIKAIYKKIKNNLRVRFDREYGFYEPHEGYDFYFFNEPYRDYYLGSGGYEKDPFYAQFHFNFKGRRGNRWFYSFSFMAHMGMGVTAFGNGPASNDIGILDESQANPNSWINGFGRLDGDRGFVAKSYLGYYLAKNLFLSVSFKYRDGNPFAFFNNLSRHGQRIIYYATIKAENEKGVKGGPREDYVADVSVRLRYGFKLFNRDAFISVSFFNLLDFGAELSEYVFSGGTRDAMELQAPRSLRLTFGWRF